MMQDVHVELNPDLQRQKQLLEEESFRQQIGLKI
jgi:hypothetical protein